LTRCLYTEIVHWVATPIMAMIRVRLATMNDDPNPYTTIDVDDSAQVDHFEQWLLRREAFWQRLHIMLWLFGLLLLIAIVVLAPVFETARE
jgi:uncharacterized membrane protein